MLLAILLFSFLDPAGDATGSGYIYPTQPSIDTSALDLREFEVSSHSGKLRFKVSLGSLQNPWNLPSGYSAGVIDIFVKTPRGGGRTLSDLQTKVAGSGGWEYHLRASGAGANLWQSGTSRSSSSSTSDNINRNQQIDLEAPSVSIRGSSLVIDSAIPAGKYAYWVTSSLYSPLSKTGILPQSTQPSVSAVQVSRPNMPIPVDVLAEAKDLSVYRTGLLSPVGASNDLRVWTLLLCAVASLLVAILASIKIRRRS